jgi:hypothetical protein
MHQSKHKMLLDYGEKKMKQNHNFSFNCRYNFIRNENTNLGFAMRM